MTDVLIVDDSPVVRKVARRILEVMHLKAREASGGNQALAACALAMPDAILVDGNMPELDGYEFVKQLRRMPAGARTKVVFCLCENNVSQIARATYAGADEVMLKPFDSDLMRSKFSNVLGL
jgi:two-component system, chemotaxis family, chemotaxis protein CheY